MVPSPLMSSVATLMEDVIHKDKESIIEFAETYSIDLASERFSIPKSTLKTWLKSNKIPIKPIYNSPGQGRKITYPRELDNEIADHIRSLLAKGERVSVQEMCSYARTLVQKENPEFTASTGWAQRFLTRHNIDLNNQNRRLAPSSRNHHGNSLSPASDSRGRPLSYSAELDNNIADWVRHRTDAGDVVTNSELRRYAKEIINKENSNFTGSASWAQNFLLRHRLSLHPSFLSTNDSDKSEMEPPITCTPTPTPSSNELTEVVTSSQSSSTTILNNTPSSLAPPPPPVEDTVSSTLALLAGEGLPVETQLTQAALSLSDLTSDATLADLLNSTQDPATAPFTSSTLESSAAAYISLGQHLSELVGSVAAVSSGQNVLEGLACSTPQSTLQSTGLPHSSSTPSNSNTETVGSGTRPLSYTKETDQQLANWVKEQQAHGLKVTFASLRAYAKKLVSNENPNFNASVGWVTPFLLRHNLDLKVNDRKIRTTRKTTHPRKLSAKDGQNVEEISEIPPEDSSMEENEIEITALPIITTPNNDTSFTSNPEEIPPQSEVTMVTTPEVSLDEFKTPSIFKSSLKPSVRSRHTLAEKLDVVRLMRQFNLAGHYVSRLLGIATSTLSGWIKLVDQKGDELEALSTNRKRSNRSGQGRPLTYSKEKDEIIADWVRKQQEEGVPVTATDLSTYASTIINEENQNFVASVGWRHKFLQRHNLQLQQLHASYKPDSTSPSTPPTQPTSDDQQVVPIPVQTEEVCTDDYTVDIIEKVYPAEVIQELVDWTKAKIADKRSLHIQQFCKYAEELILPLDALFVATLGWAFKFLHSHGIFLDPKPMTINDVSGSRKRSLTEGEESASKKSVKSIPSMVNTIAINPDAVSISPSTGNLCKALLSLSSSSQQEQDPIVMETVSMETSTPQGPNTSTSGEGGDSLSKSYFNKTARDFSPEEKEEVVRYANATTLQKAALRYSVAAPTVWRWRMELKLHQPKYTANQKKYIVKFAETNSLKEASQRFGITTKTIQNWRRALQLDGTLSDVEIAAIAPPLLHEVVSEGEGLTTPTSSGLMTEEVIPLDNSHFQYVVDGGEVAEGNRIQGQQSTTPTSSSLELTHEVQVQDVGMEYDVISSEGHAAKPRCTPEEKNHILQYALEHSIREASVKYGVSPGTLYYWKKNHIAGGTQTKESKGKSNDISLDESSNSTTTTPLETTVVNVPMTMDILAVSQAVNNNTDPLQALTGDSDLLSDSSVPTTTLINAITQTLASATPEQLQSLQQITSDLNLLQAVTSLINSHDTQLRQTTPTEGLARESLSGGISSPTDVLVSFNHQATPTNQQDIVTETVEEVATMATTGEEVIEKTQNT